MTKTFTINDQTGRIWHDTDTNAIRYEPSASSANRTEIRGYQYENAPSADAVFQQLLADLGTNGVTVAEAAENL